MIQLYSGDNRVCSTLYENSVVTVTPHYVWEITRKGSYETYLFTNTDNSPVPYYYSVFTFSVATYSQPLNGVINANEGEYTYNVYQVATASSLDISNPIKMVETGILNIYTNGDTTVSYDKTDDDTIVYYNNL